MDKDKVLIILVVIFVLFVVFLFGGGLDERIKDTHAQPIDVQAETSVAAVAITPSEIQTVKTTVLPLVTPVVEVYRGELSASQRMDLASNSLEYVASTHNEAVEVAKRIGIPSPNMMCGPLSATMLKSVGALEEDVDPFQYWYLNPKPDKELWKLKKMMPEDRFEYFEFDEQVSTFDFSEFPLYPGDFLYLYMGRYGSFDHMLVVTRVDEQGRAYSVTNTFEMIDGKPTGGYVISEVMLYDPSNPGVGQFATYNSSEYAYIGRTGYKFMVVRLK